jgi:hypothetical protein
MESSAWRTAITKFSVPDGRTELSCLRGSKMGSASAGQALCRQQERAPPLGSAEARARRQHDGAGQPRLTNAEGARAKTHCFRVLRSFRKASRWSDPATDFPVAGIRKSPDRPAEGSWENMPPLVALLPEEVLLLAATSQNLSCQERLPCRFQVFKPRR